MLGNLRMSRMTISDHAVKRRNQKSTRAARRVDNKIRVSNINYVRHELRNMTRREVLTDGVTSGESEEALVKLAQVIVSSGTVSISLS